jgi:t-SNARE complex subunit (syntaxin)
MMMAPTAVMPAAATRAADYEPRGAAQDCHERIARLEKDLVDLANAVSKLQSIVGKQTQAIEAVNEKVETLKRDNQLK